MEDTSPIRRRNGRMRNCIYREKETVIVTCSTCFRPRLIQHRSHWGDKIPMLDCRFCAQQKRHENKHPANKLRDFEDMLEVMEIVKSYFTETTPLMVKTTVNAMLKTYRGNQIQRAGDAL